MFPDQGRADGRQVRAGVWNRAVGGIIDALQAIARIEPGGGVENVGVTGGICADNHLCGLSTGRKRRRFCAFQDTAGFRVLYVINLIADIRHRLANGLSAFLRGVVRQSLFGWQLHIHRQSVRMFAGQPDQFRICLGDRFQVDIAAKAMILAKAAGHLQQLLHCVIRRTDNSGGEKEPFNIVAFVEVEGQFDDFFNGKPLALYVRRRPIDAVAAVEDAKIRQQNFQQ